VEILWYFETFVFKCSIEVGIVYVRVILWLLAVTGNFSADEIINSFLTFTRECWQSVVFASNYASCAENVVNMSLVANNCSTNISANKMLCIFHLVKLILKPPTLPYDRWFVSVIGRLQNKFSSSFGDIQTRIIWTWMFQNSFAIAIFWFPV
jgi:hypothetical protein